MKHKNLFLVLILVFTVLTACNTSGQQPTPAPTSTPDPAVDLSACAEYIAFMETSFNELGEINDLYLEIYDAASKMVDNVAKLNHIDRAELRELVLAPLTEVPIPEKFQVKDCSMTSVRSLISVGEMNVAKANLVGANAEYMKIAAEIMVDLHNKGILTLDSLKSAIEDKLVEPTSMPSFEG